MEKKNSFAIFTHTYEYKCPVYGCEIKLGEKCVLLFLCDPKF
jgi:hypothetical protein